MDQHFAIHTDFTQPDDGIGAHFSNLVVERGLTHWNGRVIQTDPSKNKEIKELVIGESKYTSLFLGAEQKYGNNFSISEYERPDDPHKALVMQTLWPNCNYRVIVVASDPALAEKLVEEYSQKVPVIEDTEERGNVKVNFWYLAANGPIKIARTLEVPEWDDIRINYNAKTLNGLDSLMNEKFRPVGPGQFILWSGEPGTGKTTALRSLSQQWRNWCDIHYITDPEQFFGQAGYLMNFLGLAANTGYEQYDYGYDQEEPDETDEEERWMMLVFEDTGELLSRTAKSETGQGLSRFLNVVDGLIGQGLKIIVLITTNEEFGKMHPAVIRPGRCRANIEFNELDAAEVEAWCEKHRINEEPDLKQYNLADLYSLLNEQIKTEEGSNHFGFANA